MSKVRICIEIPSRAYEYLKVLTGKEHPGAIKRYVLTVLLRHLSILPGIDLSRSPYSTKGCSDGESSSKNDQQGGRANVNS